jgi:ABC-type glycerol-3-phosphate transport system substrate-binding protein
MSSSIHRPTRRHLLKIGLGTAAAGALAACTPQSPAAPPTVPAKPTAGAPATTPLSSAAPTTAPAKPTTGAPATTPLSFVFHTFPLGSDSVPRFLETYPPQYADKVELAVVPKDYASTTETRLRAGVDVDVLVADEGFPAKWLKANWITDVEGLPGLDQLQKDMVPAALEASKVDGKMVALPGNGLTKVMVYNAEVLDKAGMKPAQTWEEFYEQGVKMKKDGHADFPFVPMWTKAFGLAAYFLIGDAYSRGAKDFFDPKTLQAQYDTDPAVVETLEFWKRLWDAKLVPPDVLTVDHNATTAIFGAGGRAYFQHNLAQSAFPLNTQPDKFNVAGKIKLMMYPGTTRECLTGTNLVCMTPRQDKARTWTLARFLGGTDKNGDYLVPAKWRAITLGAEVAYKPVLEDPEVQASLGKWVDTKVLAQQKERGRLLGPVTQAPWFAEWADRATADIQNAIVGSVTPKEALKSSADFARAKSKA